MMQSFFGPTNRDILFALEGLRRTLNYFGENVGIELDNLKAEVSEAKSVMSSAVVLINGLKSRLDEAIASGDPQALQSLSDELDTGANELAAAVKANTSIEGAEPVDAGEQPGV